MYKNNMKKESGFTLIEMLVSIAVFMSVMVVAVSALVSVINVNRKTQQIKSVVDNATFVIDSISRNARVGTNFSCKINVTDSNFIGDCPTGGAVFEYQATDGTYTQFKFVASNLLSAGQGNIQRLEGCPDASGNGCPIDPQTGLPNWQSMTAPTSTVNITSLNFYVLGVNHQNDVTVSTRTQPRLIITAEGDIIGTGGEKTDFTLQTTASERSRESSN